MYNIQFHYDDQTHQDFSHIKKVTYLEEGKPVEISGDELLTHEFHISGTMHLFADTASYFISTSNTKVIRITKEK